MKLHLPLLLSALLPAISSCFVSPLTTKTSGATWSTAVTAVDAPTSKDLDEKKAALVYVCTRVPKATLQEVRDAVDRVEVLGEQVRAC